MIKDKTVLLRSLEILGLILYGLMVYSIFIDLWVWKTLLPWYVLPGMLVTSFIFADFLSGLVHWTFDTFGNPETPFLGPVVIFPFREHHVLPQKICQHGFLETNGNSFLLCAIVLFVLNLTGYTWPMHAKFYFQIGMGWLALVSLFAVLANQVHSWSHADHTSVLIRYSQRMRLILSPEHHAGHHQAPFRRRYCILNGVCDLMLDRIQFWDRLESVVRSIMRFSVSEK